MGWLSAWVIGLQTKKHQVAPMVTWADKGTSDEQDDEQYNFVELESLEKTTDGSYEWRERAR